LHRKEERREILVLADIEATLNSVVASALQSRSNVRIGLRDTDRMMLLRIGYNEVEGDANT
jgi:hypothetical protein